MNSLKKNSESLDYFINCSIDQTINTKKMHDTMEKFKGRKQKKKIIKTEPVFEPIGSVSPWL